VTCADPATQGLGADAVTAEIVRSGNVDVTDDDAVLLSPRHSQTALAVSTVAVNVQLQVPQLAHGGVTGNWTTALAPAARPVTGWLENVRHPLVARLTLNAPAAPQPWFVTVTATEPAIASLAQLTPANSMPLTTRSGNAIGKAVAQNVLFAPLHSQIAFEESASMRIET
jgi:hypothetical protein